MCDHLPLHALSIRQPFAELILRGVKTVEYRSVRTRKVGERFYIYASKAPGRLTAFEEHGLQPADLPAGVIVGTAVIRQCMQGERGWEWHLENPQRLAKPLKPTGRPQPM